MMKFIVTIFTAFVSVLVTPPDAFSQSLDHMEDTVQLATVNVYGGSMGQRFSADSIALTREIEAMLASDQKYRKRHGLYKKHYQEQRSIDSMNTMRMMELIKEYGFTSMNKWTGKRSGILPHIILVHAPKNYFDTVKPIIESEYKKGRMSQFEYDHTMWHLNGRKGIPGIADLPAEEKQE